MKIHVIKQRRQGGNGGVLKAIQRLKFKVIASNSEESPLHCLPELVQLLAEKHLTAYIVRFLLNPHGHFDLDIEAEYPQVNTLNESCTLLDCDGKKITAHKVVLMDNAKKIRRLCELFYPKFKNSSLLMTEMDYSRFIDDLANCHPVVHGWNDKQLYALPALFTNLQEAYEFIEVNETKLAHDGYYQALKESHVEFVIPEMDKYCPFDDEKLIQEQLVLQMNSFRLSFNYLPLAGTPFHLMVIPNSHSSDFSTATPQYLFELEAILKALMNFDRRMVLYMKKHACAGMSIGHMHVHTLLPPSFKAFRSHVYNQLRYFASIILHKKTDIKKFTKRPLSPKQMKDKRLVIETRLQEKLNEARMK